MTSDRGRKPLLIQGAVHVRNHETLVFSEKTFKVCRVLRGNRDPLRIIEIDIAEADGPCGVDFAGAGEPNDFWREPSAFKILTPMSMQSRSTRD